MNLRMAVTTLGLNVAEAWGAVNTAVRPIVSWRNALWVLALGAVIGDFLAVRDMLDRVLWNPDFVPGQIDTYRPALTLALTCAALLAASLMTALTRGGHDIPIRRYLARYIAPGVVLATIISSPLHQALAWFAKMQQPYPSVFDDSRVWEFMTGQPYEPVMPDGLPGFSSWVTAAGLAVFAATLVIIAAHSASTWITNLDRKIPADGGTTCSSAPGRHSSRGSLRRSSRGTRP